MNRPQPATELEVDHHINHTSGAAWLCTATSTRQIRLFTLNLLIILLQCTSIGHEERWTPLKQIKLG